MEQRSGQHVFVCVCVVGGGNLIGGGWTSAAGVCGVGGARRLEGLGDVVVGIRCTGFSDIHDEAWAALWVNLSKHAPSLNGAGGGAQTGLGREG